MGKPQDGQEVDGDLSWSLGPGVLKGRVEASIARDLIPATGPWASPVLLLATKDALFGRARPVAT
jgi:hypothetical protein